MIREITLYPELVAPYGLEPSNTIEGLDRVVILTGPNGAGKSRCLRLVKDLLDTAPRAAQDRAALAAELGNLEAGRGAEKKKQRLAFLDRLVESGGVLVDGPDGLAPPTPRDVCIDLTLRPPGLVEDRGDGGQDRDPLPNLYRSSSNLIERAARAMFNAQHPQLAGRPEVIEAARDAERLDALLAALLDKRIEPEVDTTSGAVHARLGGRRFDVTELSSGERILMTWAVLLHSHAPELRDAILLIDEPEVHLHPASAVRLLSRLWSDRILGPRGQVWMATHSPVVLLSARVSQVLLLEGGSLRWSDVSAPQVLGGLAQGTPPQVQLTPAPLPVGESDFQKLRRAGRHYVDKTGFIAEVLQNPAEVLLFSRPRRFGKTMNQSMLRYFLERSSEERRDLFEDLEIWRDNPALRHFQRYPVIALTFKDVKARTWSACRESLTMAIAQAFEEHRFLLEGSTLSAWEAERFDEIISNTARDALLQDALRLLSGALFRHHGERVVILIDEYDTPIHSAYEHGYYDEVVDFFRAFLSGGLKDNPSLFKGVLTGVLRVAKESLFSGLNNVVAYSSLRPEFASHFGFTERDVSQLLRATGKEDRQRELQAWYDGYRFGDETIYNPWSVANYLNQRDQRPRPYWVDTSDDALVRRPLIYRGVGLHGDLQVLLRGEPIHKVIAEDVVLRDIDQRPDAVWSLLLFSGYLTLTSRPEPDAEQRLALTIPNKEVMSRFDRLVQENLIERLGSEEDASRLTQALLGGDERTLEHLLQRFLVNCMSSQSLAVRTPEMYYEAFLLGLLVRLRPDYQVETQQSAGFGRADMLITPRQPGWPGVVLELKSLGERELVEAALDRAMEQIEDRRYMAKLEERGASPVHAYAAVFDGQRVRIRKRAS